MPHEEFTIEKFLAPQSEEELRKGLERIRKLEEKRHLIVPDPKDWRLRTILRLPDIPPMPREPSPFQAFVHGLTFGLFGDEPDTLTKKALSFAGEVAGIGVLSALTGGIGTAILRPATALGRVGIEVGSSAVTGGIVSGITEEEDKLLPLEFAGISLLFRLPTLYRLIRGKKEIPGTKEQIGEEPPKMTQKEETVHKEVTEFVKPEFRPALEEKIEHLNKLFDEFKEIEGRIRDKYKTLIDDREFFFAWKKNKTLAKREVESIFDRLGKVVTSDERTLIERTLGESSILPKREVSREIERLIRHGKLSTNESIVRPPHRLIEEIEESKNYLDFLDSLTSLGLTPKRGTAKVEERVSEIHSRIREAMRELTTHPRRREILDETLSTLDDIGKGMTQAVSPEFLGSAEFKKFTRAISELVGRGDLHARSHFAMNLIKDLERHEETVNRALYTNLKRITSTYDKAFERKAQTLLERLSYGDSKILENLDDIRPTAGRLLLKLIERSDIEKINPTASAERRDLMRRLSDPRVTRVERDRLTKALSSMDAQIALSAISNPKLMEDIINANGDRILEKVYLLYRASVGDSLSREKLSWILRTELEEKIRDSVASNLIRRGGEEILRLGGGDGGGMVQAGRDALALFLDDMNPIRRQIHSPKFYIERLMQTVENPTALEFLKKTWDWLDSFGRARQEILRTHAEEIRPQLEQFSRLLKDTEKVHGKSVAEHGLSLIDDISRLANELIERGIERTQVEEIITKKIRSQPLAVQKIYDEFRSIADRALERVNSAIKKYNEYVDTGVLPGGKIPLIERRPGWTPFLYDGNFVLRVRTDEGKIIYTDIVKDKKQAIESIEHFLKTHPQQIGFVSLEPRWSSFRDDAEMMGGLLKDMDLVLGIPVREVKKLIGARTLRPETVNQVFFTSLLPRTLSLSARKIETLQALLMNLTAGTRFANYLVPIKQGEILHNVLREGGLKTFADFVKTYTDDMIGRPRNAERAIDGILNTIVRKMTEIPPLSYILESFGIRENGRTLRAVSNALTFMGRLMTIGLNPATALINQTLYLVNVVPVVGWRNAVYGARHLGKIWKRESEFSDLIKESGILLTSGGLGMKEILSSPRVLEGRLLRGLDRLDNLQMWAFNKSEELVRGATLISARRQAEELAKKISDQKGVVRTWQEKLLKEIAEGRGLPLHEKGVLNEYARRIMQRTNFVYDLSDVPELIRNPLARPFMQFKNFIIKELEFWFGVGRQSKVDLAKSLGIFSALGGIMGLPFIAEVDFLGRTALGFSPLHWIRQHVPEVVAYGIGASAGVDISGRISLGGISWLVDPNNFWGIAPARLSRALFYLTKGHVDKAGELAMPNFARIVDDALELLQTGGVRNPFLGGVEVIREEEITNPLQLFGRLIGFPTTLETDFRLEDLSARAIKKQTERINSYAIRRASRAMIERDYDKAYKIMKKYGIDHAKVKRAVQIQTGGREEYIERLLPDIKEEEFRELYE